MLLEISVLLGVPIAELRHKLTYNDYLLYKKYIEERRPQQNTIHHLLVILIQAFYATHGVSISYEDILGTNKSDWRKKFIDNLHSQAIINGEKN